jgi:hypothetical protein
VVKKKEEGMGRKGDGVRLLRRTLLTIIVIDGH